jgi:hypothetical protein
VYSFAGHETSQVSPPLQGGGPKRRSTRCRCVRPICRAAGEASSALRRSASRCTAAGGARSACGGY